MLHAAENLGAIWCKLILFYVVESLHGRNAAVHCGNRRLILVIHLPTDLFSFRESSNCSWVVKSHSWLLKKWRMSFTSNLRKILNNSKNLRFSPKNLALFTLIGMATFTSFLSERLPMHPPPAESLLPGSWWVIRMIMVKGVTGNCNGVVRFNGKGTWKIRLPMHSLCHSL